MYAELKSPECIELTPESELEEAIVSDGKWKAEIVEPKPFELNRRRIVLTREKSETQTPANTE